MGDEELYFVAINELESGEKVSALWAKAKALAEGNQEKTRHLYVKLRAEQLAKNKTEEAPVLNKHAVDEFDLEYLPVSDFAKIKSIPETTVIEMIRNGLYKGRIRDNVWYINREEVESVAGSVIPSISHTDTSAITKTLDKNKHYSLTMNILFLFVASYGVAIIHNMLRLQSVNIFALLGSATGLMIMPIIIVFISGGIYRLINKKAMPEYIEITWIIWTMLSTFLTLGVYLET